MTISLSLEADGRARLLVADDGVGLPAGLDVARPRSLGLRLVHTLARQIGGAVEFRRGAGTAVLVTFSPASAGIQSHGE